MNEIEQSQARKHSEVSLSMLSELALAAFITEEEKLKEQTKAQRVIHGFGKNEIK